QRRVDLPTTEDIRGYVADFRTCLREGTILERKALIRNFVAGIEVVDDEATLTYTIPMPNDGVTQDSAAVLDFVQSGLPGRMRLRGRVAAAAGRQSTDQAVMPPWIRRAAWPNTPAARQRRARPGRL
ncbi:MAG: hypothetical protein OXG33_03270, partial [Chloroflexi bacterium]|nr:hypothetical protein [Chloroflexota bacterium]